MPKDAKTNGAAKSVTLPFERPTKNWLVYSTIESRSDDKEVQKKDTAIINKVYLRKDTFGETKPEAIKLSVEAAK